MRILLSVMLTVLVAATHVMDWQGWTRVGYFDSPVDCRCATATRSGKHPGGASRFCLYGTHPEPCGHRDTIPLGVPIIPERAIDSH